MEIGIHGSMADSAFIFLEFRLGLAILSFSNTDSAFGMSVSNRWSCATLAAGLKHVDQATLDAEEKALLAELQDPSHLYRILVFSKKTMVIDIMIQD